jgi:hypothetical protein
VRKYAKTDPKVEGFEEIDTHASLGSPSLQEARVKVLKFMEASPTNPGEDEQRLVYGIVLRPNAVDGHLDIMTTREVAKTAHRFLANGGTMGIMHEKEADAVAVESYLAPIDFTLGNGEVRKGDWILVSLVINDNLWDRIKSGELSAYSPGGKSKARILV